ncbi:hypothetical protein Ancab_005720 [Ancistrocladus abbreviatus]
MEPSRITVAEAKEEEPQHECQELELSSFPKDFFGYPLYQYQGFWCPDFSLQPVIHFQRHFQAHDTDIIVINMPKTGTTWTKSLLFSIINRSSRHASESPLLKHNPHELILSFEIMIYNKTKYPDLSKIPSPRLFSTHVPYPSLPQSIKNSKCKIIYICRNPLDTFNSSWHYYSKLDRKKSDVDNQMAEYFKKFCKGRSPYGPFFDHVLGYWRQSLERPGKVLFLKYEDLKDDGAMQLKRMAKFIGYPFSLEEEKGGIIEEIINLCSIESLRQLEVNKYGKCDPDFENNNFFRKGQVGDWVNHLSPSMVDHLNSITEERLRDYGLHF